jgi:hypothetical protein
MSAQCPYCWLNVYSDDPNAIRDRRKLWHGPCWALVYAKDDG